MNERGAADFTNVALWSIELQRRRLRAIEPEDGEFLLRRCGKWQRRRLRASPRGSARAAAFKYQLVTLSVMRTCESVK
jgi:hypothetical protein